MIATARAWFGGQEGDREDVLQLSPEHVEGDLRTGHVGDDQVEEAGREVDPRRLGEKGRRGEVVEARDHLGAERLLGPLQALHRLADDLQAAHRVVDVDRQRAAHRGDPVAELAALVLGADRDRDQGPQLQALRAHAPAQQPAPQGAGDDREHDVVDGAAERVLDLLEGLQLRARPDDSAGAGRSPVFSGTAGAGSANRPGDLSQAPRPPRRRAATVASGCCTAATNRAARRNGAATASVTPLPTSSAVVGSGPGAHSESSAAAGSGTGLTSKRTVEMSTPETPSTIAWWVLLTSAKRFRSRPCTSHSSHSGFERSSCWEKTRPARRRSCILGARIGQRRVAHVVGEVEARVVDPKRPARLQRRHGQLLAKARHQRQAPAHVLDRSPRSEAAAPRRSGSPRRACGWSTSRC